MILIRLLRSLYDTTSNRPSKDCPIEINRYSETVCAGSAIAISSGSRKMVAASSKETACFLWLRRFLRSSHSTSNASAGFTPPHFCLGFASHPASGTNDRFTTKARALASVLDQNVLRQYFFQRIGQHPAPPGPIVIYISPPKIKRVRDSFCLQDVGEVLAALRRFV